MLARQAVAPPPPEAADVVERGVVEVLRTRALIAEITLSLTRLRDLVAERTASPVPAARKARLALSRG